MGSKIDSGAPLAAPPTTQGTRPRTYEGQVSGPNRLRGCCSHKSLSFNLLTQSRRPCCRRPGSPAPRHSGIPLPTSVNGTCTPRANEATHVAPSDMSRFAAPGEPTGRRTPTTPCTDIEGPRGGLRTALGHASTRPLGPAAELPGDETRHLPSGPGNASRWAYGRDLRRSGRTSRALSRHLPADPDRPDTSNMDTGNPQNQAKTKNGTHGGDPPRMPSRMRGAARIRTGDKGFAVLCLTTWPRRQQRRGGRREPATPPFRAGNRTRTGDPHLGKVMLYQLSYSRVLDEEVRMTFRRVKTSERPRITFRPTLVR
jgi:hypothetical protein